MVPGDHGLVPRERNRILPGMTEVVPQDTELVHMPLFSLPSPHMTPERMAELAIQLGKLERDRNFTGTIVTHGTDTLEESAFLADIYLKGLKPTVFTAAMRSPSEMGVDGPRNLRGAIRTACSEFHNFGVTVVLNDEIHSAQRVTKTCTSNVSSFASPGYGPLGFVDEDSIILHRTPIWRISLPPGKLVMEQRVGYVRTAAGYGAEIIDFLRERGNRGIVIEAFGRGNVPPDAADAVGRAVEAGVVVLICSRCYMGRVLDVYGYPGGGRDLAERGAILAGDMQGHKLKLFLMAALGMGKSAGEIEVLLSRL
jgi:L-asparaginase